MNQQVLAAHELQVMGRLVSYSHWARWCTYLSTGFKCTVLASRKARSGLRRFCSDCSFLLLIQTKVHTELAKLRLKNRDEYARVRADARTAYEQRIQEVTNDSLADSSFLASFIESSLAGALVLFMKLLCRSVFGCRCAFAGAIHSSLEIEHALWQENVV